ncbi:MAG: trypsin-like peptidase domain-containing protein [Pyrinomonadaceae bacterium]
MASGLVIHVEAGEERHTEVLTLERIRIGRGAGCDLCFRGELLPDANDIVLELARTNGHYLVTRFDTELGLTHNGAPLTAGAPIEDGDKVRVGQRDLELQFFPLAGEAPQAVVPKPRQNLLVAPFIEQAAIEAAATARRDDAKVFLREFTRELIREINPSTKLATLFIALALVGGTLYIGFSVFKELKQSRRQLEAANQQIAQINNQVLASQEQFKQVDETNQGIIYSLSLAPKVWSEYGSGVCLISGTYIFVERGTGRPLRYPEGQSVPEELISGDAVAAAAQTPLLTPEGRGPIAEFPYVGTGFHVGGGYVLTNRHVAADPWVADERSLIYSSTVSGQPRISKLLAYFPGLRQPLPLRLKNSSRQDDLAVCSLEVQQLPEGVPVLPIDDNTDAVAVGQRVVLMGFPSGPDRILASLPEDDANGIKQRFGSSLDVLIGHLSQRNLIKPLTTQGHITGIESRRLVYDARTAEGGSGAPLFGQSGRVIGVNFAVFTELSDANFAVPIRYAVAILQRAGWKPPEPADTGTTAMTAAGNANSNANAKDARGGGSNANQSR